MSREAGLEELLKASFDSNLNNQYTIIPCIVIAVRDSLNGQMVDIQPTINQKLRDGTISERAQILGVPVSFQVSKKAGFTFPIEAGDTGTALFSMRNMDGWKAGNGRPTSPMNFAKMDKSDAIFLPGIQPPGLAVNNPAKHILPHDTKDTVLFGNLGGVEAEVRIRVDGSIGITTSNMPIIIEGSDVTVNAASSISLNAPTATIDIGSTTWIGSIIHQGDYSQTGNYTLVGGQATFNGVVFNTHRHAPSVVPPSN